MKEHPILFSGEMVKAILEGRKTQTRRVVNPQPQHLKWSSVSWDERCIDVSDYKSRPYYVICPYGKPGSRLWVRETFQLAKATGSVGDEWIGDELLEWEGPLPRNKPGVNTFPSGIGFEWEVYYKASQESDVPVHWWRPSIFMPRWASRINLEVAHVRIDRLQDITQYDAKLEGVSNVWAWNKERNAEHPEHFVRGVLNPYVANYSVLWDEINGKGAWDLNPWVWVIEFKVVRDA